MEYLIIAAIGLAAAGAHPDLRPDRIMVRYGIKLRAAGILASRIWRSAIAQARREWPDALLEATLKAVRWE